MKIVLYIVEILIPIGFIIWFIKYYTSNNEEKYFKKIDFSHKDEYICLYYLSGDLLENPGHCVISKTEKGFFIEVEAFTGNVDSYFLPYDKFSMADIKPVDCVINREKSNVYDPTNKDEYKKLGLTVRRGYEIRLITNEGETMFLVSKKNVKHFFK